MYYGERYIEDGQNSNNITDSGANVVDGITVASKFGIATEAEYPYDTSKCNLQPSKIIFKEAAKNKFNLKSYEIPVDDQAINKIKTSIVTNGTPVLLAISVYDSFESQDVAQSGIVSIPDTDNEQCLGYFNFKKNI